MLNWITEHILDYIIVIYQMFKGRDRRKRDLLFLVVEDLANFSEEEMNADPLPHWSRSLCVPMLRPKQKYLHVVLLSKLSTTNSIVYNIRGL